MKNNIENKLKEKFQPLFLAVEDESEKHRGHQGYRQGGETHFKVTIASQYFKGLNRVTRQREVYQLLNEELKSKVHALSLTIYDHEEYQ
jgi:BolA protein